MKVPELLEVSFNRPTWPLSRLSLEAGLGLEAVADIQGAKRGPWLTTVELLAAHLEVSPGLMAQLLVLGRADAPPIEAARQLAQLAEEAHRVSVRLHRIYRRPRR